MKGELYIVQPTQRNQRKFQIRLITLFDYVTVERDPDQCRHIVVFIIKLSLMVQSSYSYYMS